MISDNSIQKIDYIDDILFKAVNDVVTYLGHTLESDEFTNEDIASLRNELLAKLPARVSTEVEEDTTPTRSMDLFSFTPPSKEERVEILSKFLGVDTANIYCWAEHTMTVGEDAVGEYAVLRQESFSHNGDHFKIIGSSRGYNIFQSV